MELLAAAGVLFSWSILLYYWSDLPASIPRHFDASGEADAWGGKGSLVALPAIGLAIYVAMTALSRFPHIYNFPVKLTEENVQRQYRCARVLLAVVKAEIVWLFSYIEWRTIQTALGKAHGLGAAFLPVLLVTMTITIVVYFSLASMRR